MVFQKWIKTNHIQNPALPFGTLVHVKCTFTEDQAAMVSLSITNSLDLSINNINYPLPSVPVFPLSFQSPVASAVRIKLWCLNYDKCLTLTWWQNKLPYSTDSGDDTFTIEGWNSSLTLIWTFAAQTKHRYVDLFVYILTYIYFHASRDYPCVKLEPQYLDYPCRKLGPQHVGYPCVKLGPQYIDNPCVKLGPQYIDNPCVKLGL